MLSTLFRGSVRMLFGVWRASKQGHSEVRQCSQLGESEMEPSVMQSGVEIGERGREGPNVVNARYTSKTSV